MRILVKESGSIISDLTFGEEPVQIGSGLDCSVRLPDMQLASVHGRLMPQDDGVWHYCPEQNNSTAINGHVSRNEVRVGHGDELLIGGFTIQIYMGMTEHKGRRKERVPSEPRLPPGTHTRSRRESVELSPARLQSCCDFATALSTARDSAGVIDCVMDEILRRRVTRACWIGVRSTHHGPILLREGRTYKGQHFDDPLQFETLSGKCLQGGLTIVSKLGPDEVAGSLVAAPLATAEGRFGFLYADSRPGGEGFTAADVDHMMVLGQLVGSRLRSLQEAHHKARQAVNTAESSIVRAVQAKLDPSGLPEWDTLQLAAHCSQGSQQSGDIYHIMRLANGAAAMFIGHVKAPDVHAAVSMIEVRTAFRIAALHSDMPHVMMGEFSWLLGQSGKPPKLDCMVVLLDPNNGALLHCRAGNAGAIVVSANGNVRRLDDASRPALGTQQKYEHATRQAILNQRETLVLYTPGVFEICNPSGATFGEHAFIDSLCDGFGMSARAALDETVSELESFRGGGEHPEDVTILLAHRPD